MIICIFKANSSKSLYHKITRSSSQLDGLVLQELHINNKGLLVVLLSIVGVLVTISSTSAKGVIFGYFYQIATGLDHSQKIIAADKESITVDEKELEHSPSVPVDNFWTTPYLKEMRQIDSKKNWPIAIYLHQDSIATHKQLAVNISKKTLPVAKPAQIKSFLVKQPDLKFPITGYVEGGALYGYLTSGYGIWSNQYLRGFAHIDNKNSLGLFASNNYEYREHGDYAVVDQLHTFNEEWNTRVSMGISNKSIFVPKYYMGGTVFRKLKTNRALVPYFGVHAYWWRPIYSTQDINPGIVYYFQKPWIVELGTFINRSNPGSIYSASVYAVAIQGRDKEHYLTLRLGVGKEAYLPLGAGIPAAVGYFSAVITGTWRQWWGRDWGTNIVAENYNNPFYKRYSASVGVFKDFSI